MRAMCARVEETGFCNFIIIYFARPPQNNKTLSIAQWPTIVCARVEKLATTYNKIITWVWCCVKFAYRWVRRTTAHRSRRVIARETRVIPSSCRLHIVENCHTDTHTSVTTVTSQQTRVNAPQQHRDARLVRSVRTRLFGRGDRAAEKSSRRRGSRPPKRTETNLRAECLTLRRVEHASRERTAAHRSNKTQTEDAQAHQAQEDDLDWVVRVYARIQIDPSADIQP